MMRWNEHLSCGIEIMDNQHKNLVAMVNELYEIIRNNPNPNNLRKEMKNIEKIFSGLRDYTVYHFGYEEDMMNKYGYNPEETLYHKFEHDAFVLEMVKIQLDECNKDLDKVLLEVLDFAAGWIEKHIMQNDKKSAAFFVSQGAK